MVLDDVFNPSKSKAVASENDLPLDRRLASPIDRLAANVADMVLYLPVVFLVCSSFGRASREAQLLGQDDAWLTAIASAVALGTLTLILYQTVAISLFGATPGQKALGLRVVSIWTRERPRPIDAFVRSLVWCLELCAVGIPWISLFSNERRRALHDRAADTVVITVKRGRAMGAPTLAEMSLASGFQSALFAVLALAISIQLAERHRRSAALDTAVAAAEEQGRLCPEVREALEKSDSQPAGVAERLKVALSMYVADSLDGDCLDSEAEFAIWRNQERSLAYLAKALASDDENKADSYFHKACADDSNDGDVCAMVGLVATSADDDAADGDADDKAANKAAAAAEDARVEKILAKVKPGSAEFVKLAAIRHFLSGRDFARALELIDGTRGSRKVGAFLARARARALWEIGQRAEARTVLRSSLDLFDSASRIEMARWFCLNESVSNGCTNDTRYACERLTSSVARFEGWLLKPEIAVAYIRAQSCSGRAESAVSESARWAKLSEQVPLPEAKALIRALAMLDEGKKSEGIKALELLVAASPEGRGPFVMEASSRLAELASDVAGLGSARKVWETLDVADDGWATLGRSLLNRLVALRAWDQALSVGLKMVQNDPYDRGLFESLVVAAHGSGNRRMALGLLENALKLRASVASRAPASVEGFDEVARQLLGKEQEK